MIIYLYLPYEQFTEKHHESGAEIHAAKKPMPFLFNFFFFKRPIYWEIQFKANWINTIKMKLREEINNGAQFSDQGLFYICRSKKQ